LLSLLGLPEKAGIGYVTGATVANFTGLADLIERCCRYATVFAEGLQAAGYQILNDVVLNQVLVKFNTDELTARLIKRVQDDGTCWCGGNQWQGHTAMRIS